MPVNYKYSPGNPKHKHLVEEEDEVDSEGHEERQQSHVVEIPRKAILQVQGNKTEISFQKAGVVFASICMTKNVTVFVCECLCVCICFCF